VGTFIIEDLEATISVSRVTNSKGVTTGEWVTITTIIINNSREATSGTRPLGNRIVCRDSSSRHNNNIEETTGEDPGIPTMRPQLAFGTMDMYEQPLYSLSVNSWEQFNNFHFFRAATLLIGATTTTIKTTFPAPNLGEVALIDEKLTDQKFSLGKF
jgi:hypothetical protein